MKSLWVPTRAHRDVQYSVAEQIAENEWRFAVGYRITKNSIGFHLLPLSKQFTRQGIADF